MVKCEVGRPQTGLNPPVALAPGLSNVAHHCISSFPSDHCIRIFVMSSSILANLSSCKPPCKTRMIFDFMISFYSCLFHSLRAYLAIEGMTILSIEGSLTTHACMLYAGFCMPLHQVRQQSTSNYYSK